MTEVDSVSKLLFWREMTLWLFCSKVSHQKPVTICIIKPDIIQKIKKQEVIEKIKSRGYEILEEKEVQFTEQMAHEFYKHQKDQVGSLGFF